MASGSPARLRRDPHAADELERVRPLHQRCCGRRHQRPGRPRVRLVPQAGLLEHARAQSPGYLLRTPAASAVWAPEFWAFAAWAAGVDLMFAEAADWDRPIRFTRGVGGHMPALEVAR